MKVPKSPLLPVLLAALLCVPVLATSIGSSASPAGGTSAGGAGASAVKRHAEHMRPGPQTPTVLTAALAHDGRAVPVACSTCHATRTPDVSTRSAEQLDQFHQGLAYAHGGQSCLSCHDAGNYDMLRKADGTKIAFPAVMELCGQCHGPQLRDYKAGAHGGMNGHWDLAQGPRERNNCVDCHDPHSPAFPHFKPVLPPTDRGARQQVQRKATNKEHAHD